jgi:hypothetical protein
MIETQTQQISRMSSGEQKKTLPHGGVAMQLLVVACRPEGATGDA